MQSLTGVLKRPTIFVQPEWIKKITHPPMRANSLKEFSEFVRIYGNRESVEATADYKSRSLPFNIFQMMEDSEKLYERENEYEENSREYSSHFKAMSKSGRPILFDEYHRRFFRHMGENEKNNRDYKPILTLIDRIERLEKEIPYSKITIKGIQMDVLKSFFGSEKAARDWIVNTCKELNITPFL